MTVSGCSGSPSCVQKGNKMGKLQANGQRKKEKNQGKSEHKQVKCKKSTICDGSGVHFVNNLIAISVCKPIPRLNLTTHKNGKNS